MAVPGLAVKFQKDVSALRNTLNLYEAVFRAAENLYRAGQDTTTFRSTWRIRPLIIPGEPVPFSIDMQVKICRCNGQGVFSISKP